MSDDNIQLLVSKIVEALASKQGDQKGRVCGEHQSMADAISQINARTKHQKETIEELKRGQDKMTGTQDMLGEKMDQLKDIFHNNQLRLAEEKVQEAKEEKEEVKDLVKDKKQEANDRFGRAVAIATVLGSIIGIFLNNLPKLYAFIISIGAAKP